MESRPYSTIQPRRTKSRQTSPWAFGQLHQSATRRQPDALEGSSGPELRLKSHVGMRTIHNPFRCSNMPTKLASHLQGPPLGMSYQ